MSPLVRYMISTRRCHIRTVGIIIKHVGSGKRCPSLQNDWRSGWLNTNLEYRRLGYALTRRYEIPYRINSTVAEVAVACFDELRVIYTVPPGSPLELFSTDWTGPIPKAYAELEQGMKKLDIKSAEPFTSNRVVLKIGMRTGFSDIGVFINTVSSPGDDLLATDFCVTPSTAIGDIASHYRSRHRTRDDRVVVSTERVLTTSECDRLIAKIDLTDGDDDIKLIVDSDELRAVLDGGSVENLIRGLYGKSPSKIVLRRTKATGKFIRFHTDQAALTLQVPLSSDAACTGGRLCYIREDGSWIRPEREKGIAIVHGGDAVHGVSILSAGVDR